ncbi:hypothetical protein KKF34_14390 [Myxococcota bacterium]|nr:hypothetical protein [Myxococcota bacterium]MBU1380709.1 hypothetical protein [Myxococcota bacterium]MBU1498063.1 hypothetical protein [Myxococcota bacterium]
MEIKDILIKEIMKRSDGYWELLNTANGDKKSIQKTIKGLKKKSIEMGTTGPSYTYNLVGERVEAIAAYSTQILVKLSKEWIHPDKISLDFNDSIADLWAVAWARSLRFLKHVDKSFIKENGKIPYTVELEWKTLFEDCDVNISSVTQLIDYIVSKPWDYNHFRWLDRAKIELERQLGVEDFKIILNEKDSGIKNFDPLRVFLPRLKYISNSGKEYLNHLLNEHYCNLGGIEDFRVKRSLILLNIVLDLNVNTEIPENVVNVIIKELRKIGTPTYDITILARDIYLLLRQNWRCP